MKKFTYSAKASDNEEKWYVIDADNKILGRLASVIASRLRGKHNPNFTYHVDTGDYIIVINADKINLTGRKLENKFYYRHTGYIGGIKSISAKDMIKKRPENIIRFAVKGMLPKNKLGRKLINKLKIYAGENHPHQAQQPIPFNI